MKRRCDLYRKLRRTKQREATIGYLLPDITYTDLYLDWDESVLKAANAWAEKVTRDIPPAKYLPISFGDKQ